MCNGNCKCKNKPKTLKPTETPAGISYDYETAKESIKYVIGYEIANFMAVEGYDMSPIRLEMSIEFVLESFITSDRYATPMGTAMRFIELIQLHDYEDVLGNYTLMDSHESDWN